MMPIFALRRRSRRPAPARACAPSRTCAQPVHVLDVVVGPLAVLALRVVAGAAREVRRHAVARNRAVRDAVAVDVLVAAPLAELLQLLGRQQLAAVDRLVGIRERVRHPVVHARGRGPSSRRPASGTARRDRTPPAPSCSTPRPTHGMSMMCLVSPCERNAVVQQVALRGAGRQAGRRPDALDVEDHRRRFRVVRQAGELAPSARCRGRRSRSSSARPPSSRRSPCRATRSRPRPGRSRTSPCRSPCRCGTSSCSRSATRTATTTA